MRSHRILVVTILIIALSGCSKNPPSDKKNNHDESGVESISYKVVKTYPHDTGSYTEGFLFHENQLFESTGSPENYPEARSVIGIVDPGTGQLDIKAELDRQKYFGEGILFFKDKIYQLTYKNQTGFIYDSKTYKLTGSFSYPNREGWGLTTDGKSIIMSDGTNILTYLDPDSLKATKKLNVTFNGASVLYINELEFIKGYIYANIWTTNNIARIDPATGKVTGIINLSSLYAEAKKKYRLSESTNGIAYDSLSDRVLITGKFWPTIYEIKFSY
jgi:glutamine cyclotransferase